jgi:TRAP-type C4-dicarboxylate transport system substrate-binding protein
MHVRAKLQKHLVLAASAAILAASGAFASVANAAETIRWRVQSHWPTSSSSYKDSLERLQQVVKERTDGRLQLDLFADGALFKANETFNAVSRGIIQMGTISPGYAQDKLTLGGIASGLPFAFREVWEAEYFHRHLGFEDMIREEAAKHGVYYSTDKLYPTEMVLKRPVNSWEDFQGIKIRSSGSLQRFLSAAGAAGTYLPGSEVYPALSSGVVDGAHWGASQGAKSMGLYEVAKYHVKPALNMAADVFIVNQKAIDKLPEDIRRIFLQALDEHFWLRTNEYQYQEQIALAKAVAEDGVQVNNLPDDVQKRLTESAQQFWEEEAKRSPQAAEAVNRMKKFLGELGYM